MLYICQDCITMVIYMSQKGLRQAGGVFCCLSGHSCWQLLLLVPGSLNDAERRKVALTKMRYTIAKYRNMCSNQ